MAIQLEKENSSFNIYEQHFLIDSESELQTLENEYTCRQGDKAELPDGSYYLRHSDDYQGDLWELVKSSGGSDTEKRKITLVNEVDVTPQSAGNNLYIIQSNDSIMSFTTIEITYDDGTTEPQSIEAPLYESLIVTFDEQEYEVSIPTTISNEYDLVYGAPVTINMEQGIPSIDFSEYPFSIIAGLGSEETMIAVEDGNNHSIKIEAEVEPIIPEGTFEITENGFYAVGQYANATVDVHTGITPSGTIQITTNGVKNVTNYAYANVNVPSVEYRTATIKNNGSVSLDFIGCLDATFTLQRNGISPASSSPTTIYLRKSGRVQDPIPDCIILEHGSERKVKNIAGYTGGTLIHDTTNGRYFIPINGGDTVTFEGEYEN